MIVCLFVLSSCATTKKQTTLKEPEQLYNKAASQKISGDTDGAYSTYIYIRKNYPDHGLAPDALYKAATIIEGVNPSKSSDHYVDLIKSYPDSKHVQRAKTNLFRAYLELDKFAKASDLLIGNYTPANEKDWFDMSLKLLDGLVVFGEYEDCLNVICHMFPRSSEEGRSLLLNEWISVLDLIDDVAILARYENKVQDNRLLEALLSREVSLYTQQENHDIAKRIMERINQFPELLIKDHMAQKTYRVGVLVPLSGKWESVGQKILKGIASASRVFSDHPTSNIEYVIRDYGNDESSIPEIIAELDTKEEVIAIIGPVGEQAAKIACSEAQDRNIPTVILTQAQTGSVVDSFCFRNFISIDIQVKTMLDIANRLNISTFSILHPTDHFGNVFTELFEKMAPFYGINVVRKVSYSPKRVDYKQEVQSLIENLQQEQDTPDESEDGEEKDKEEIKVEPDFEALLIPDTAINSAMIASYLDYYNIEGVRLFGPTLWDSPDFIRVGSKNVEGAIFLSGFYLKSRLDHIQDFSDSFYYTFGYSPSIWEASAYDTASILQNLLEGESHTHDSLRERIANIKDYPGLTGSTSFFNDGYVDKVIFVLTVKHDSIVEILP